MNLDFFQNFCVLEEERNITKAANRLFISRSALNRQLLQAEEELGQSLFRRLGNTLSLTQAGEIYLDTARQVLSAINQGNLLLSDLSTSTRGTFRFGASSSWCTDILCNVFSSFHEKYPGISVIPVQKDSAELNRQLQNGQLDFAIISSLDVIPELRIEPLATFEVLLFAPETHPMAIKSRISSSSEYAQCDLSWFQDDCFCLQGPDSPLHDLLWDIFRKENFKPKVIIEQSTRELSVEMARQGVACSFLSDFLPEHDSGIAKFALSPRLYYSIVLALPEDHQISSAEKHFLSCVAQYFGTELKMLAD